MNNKDTIKEPSSTKLLMEENALLKIQVKQMREELIHLTVRNEEMSEFLKDVIDLVNNRKVDL